MPELTFDESLYDAASNELVDFSDREMITFVADLLGIPLKQNLALRPDKPDYIAEEAIFNIVKQIPKELRRGEKRADGTMQSGVLTALDYEAIIQSLVDSGPKEYLEDIYTTALGPARELNEARIESGISPGIAPPVQPTSPSSSPIAAEGMDISSYESGGGIGPVTQENQQELFQLDSSRTINNLISDLETKGGEYFFDMEGFALAGEGPNGEASWDVKSAVKYPWKLNPAELKDLQSSLGRAGYFEALNTRVDNWGMMDQQTGFAWSLLLRDAVAFGKTPAELLKQKIIARNTATNTEMFGVQRKDDSEIFNIAMGTGSELLGRGLTDQELTSLTQRFREWETDIARADWMSADPEATALTLQAKTEEYIRTKFEGDYITQNLLGFLGNFERAFK